MSKEIKEKETKVLTEEEVKDEKIGRSIKGWIISIFIIFASFIFVLDSLSLMFCLMGVGIILNPLVQNLKIIKKISKPFKTSIIIFLLIMCCVFMGQCTERINKDIAKQEKIESEIIAKQEKIENIKYFNDNRDQVISLVKKSLSDSNYKGAVAQCEKYLDIGDEELVQLHNKATKKVELGLKLKQEYEEYKKSIALKMKQDKYKREQEKVRKKARKEKVEKHFSPWDGSHRMFTMHIKQYLNDPDSYQHIKTVYFDRKDHLIVTTTFRSKNGFGGYMKNCMMAKVSLDGKVLESWVVE